MIVGFSVSPMFTDCPRVWQNFMEALKIQRREPAHDVTQLEIDRELEKYGARFTWTRLYPGEDYEPGDFVEFADEQHLSWFYLRWS